MCARIVQITQVKPSKTAEKAQKPLDFSKYTCKYMYMATITLYVRDGDTKLVEEAKAKLGDSLSYLFMDCLRDRLEVLPLDPDNEQPSEVEASAKRLSLSRQERLILANQYQILGLLDAGDADDFAQMREIVQRGYAIHYSELDEWFYLEMEASRSREILDILNMFRALMNAKGRGLSVSEKLHFAGLDANEESPEYGYVKFLVETMRRFTEVDLEVLNSHWPLMPRYRAMLTAWRKGGEKYDLTQAGINSIAAARAQAS